MSFLSDMGKMIESENVAESKDFLSSFKPLESGIYEAEVKGVYLQKSQNNPSRRATVVLDVEGREVSTTFFIIGQDGTPFNKKLTKEGKKTLCRGWNEVSGLCTLTTGKSLDKMTPGQITLEVYDFDAKKRVNKPFDGFPELKGKKIKVAIVKQLVDKKQKGANGDWEVVGTREENAAEHFYNAETNQSVYELKHQINPEAMADWENSNKGQVKDNRSDENPDKPGNEAQAGVNGWGAPNQAPLANPDTNPQNTASEW